MLDSADLRKGLKIEIDGAPYILTQFEFVKPGKGQALYKCRLKNMLTGSQFDRTYRSGEKFNEAQMEEIEMEYLYAEGDRYCFMNTKNYEQEYLIAEQVGEGIHLLKENTLCNVLFFQDKAIGVTLPIFVELKIVKADPWAKGDTAAGDSKPATLETGYVLQIPPFVDEGEIIRIDTKPGNAQLGLGKFFYGRHAASFHDQHPFTLVIKTY